MNWKREIVISYKQKIPAFGLPKDLDDSDDSGVDSD